MTAPKLPQELVCTYCGAKFMRAHGAGPIPRYCSAAHKKAAWFQRQIALGVESRLAELERELAQ